MIWQLVPGIDQQVACRQLGTVWLEFGTRWMHGWAALGGLSGQGRFMLSDHVHMGWIDIIWEFLLKGMPQMATKVHQDASETLNPGAQARPCFRPLPASFDPGGSTTSGDLLSNIGSRTKKLEN